MLSLDLFNSKFEQTLQEGAVDHIVEQDMPEEPPQQNPQVSQQQQDPVASNIKQFTTPENVNQVRKIWAIMQQHILNPDLTWQWLTLNWDKHPESVTLSPNQLFSIFKKLHAMSKQRRNLVLLTYFGDRNSFLTWLSTVKVVPRPVPKKEVPKGQQELDLKEAEKKSSDAPKFKSTRLDRLKTQARAKYPSAGSDVEALAADFVDQQDQDQEEFNKVRSVNSRQDELLKQITALNKSQDQEIDSLAGDNSQLQKNLQQIQAANAELAKKLTAMAQRRVKPTTTDVIPGPTPAAEPAGPGVSVAVDKQAPAKRDQRLVQYAKRLRQDIKNLELKTALQGPEGQQAMRQEIDALKAQLAQLQKQPDQIAQPSVAQTTVGGQPADILRKPTKAQTIGGDDMDFTDINDIDTDIADLIKSVSTRSKKAPKAKAPSPEEQMAEGSVFGQQKFDTQMDLAKLKSQLTQPKPAQTAPASTAAPQPVAYQPPARLSDLQARYQKVANLTGIKKEIERLQASATRGGRMLPRGLAADLEDYFTMDDVDSAYDEMMTKYQKQLVALQQYLGMRKVLWSPKKDVHEMRASELEESKAFDDGGREGYYGRPNRNPYEKGTQEYQDYNRGYEQFKGDKDWDVPRRPVRETNSQLPEDTKSEFKKVALEKIKKALSNPKLDPSTRKDFETRLQKIQALEEGRAGYNPLTSEKHWHEVERYLASQINDPKLDPQSKAEARQRYQEKRKEAQQKGWAK